MSKICPDDCFSGFQSGGPKFVKNLSKNLKNDYFRTNFKIFDKFLTNLGPPDWNPEKQSSGQILDKFGVRGVFECCKGKKGSQHLPHGPLDICLDLLPTTPLPPVQKRGLGTSFCNTRGRTPRISAVRSKTNECGIAVKKNRGTSVQNRNPNRILSMLKAILESHDSESHDSKIARFSRFRIARFSSTKLLTETKQTPYTPTPPPKVLHKYY